MFLSVHGTTVLHELYIIISLKEVLNSCPFVVCLLAGLYKNYLLDLFEKYEKMGLIQIPLNFETYLKICIF